MNMTTPTAVDASVEEDTGTTESVVTPVGTGPEPALRPKMRVFGEAGRMLGRVSTLERNALSGAINSMVVRHGILGRKYTSVPIAQVKQVKVDSVLLHISLLDFQRLPITEGK
jgi:sporulation protein YlmC with PRC-barrel domain